MIRRILPSTRGDWTRELELVGADRGGWDRVWSRSEVLVFKAGPLPPSAANILKQCMLSAGGDAIVSRETVCCRCDHTDAILVGMPRHLRHAAESLRGQPFGLAELGDSLARLLEEPPAVRSVPHARGVLDLSDPPVVMGILNITPDSFSDGGLYMDPGAAVARALEMKAQGASIVDAGAESTRPGSMPVPPREQIGRLLPVIEGIRAVDPVLPLSVDTSSAEVASAVLEAGADFINDTGALVDPGMASLAARTGAPVILMHMKGRPLDMQADPSYRDVLEEVFTFLAGRVEAAVRAGVRRDRILVDPGIGFGKRLEDNVLLIRRLGELRYLGCPVVLGHSRKSFIGLLTGEKDPAARDLAGLAVPACAVGRADVLRVHDVAATCAVLHVARALQGGGAW
jgi:dihydropteroate synthase